MSAQVSENTVVQDPETSWARARRLGEEGVRTCLPAVEDGGAPREERTSPDWNIVRGED